jgi:hypothetical protein
MADKASQIFDPAEPIKYAVITPDDKTAGAIDRAKKALRRLTGNDRGMWSVEVGEKKGGLHINAVYQGETITRVTNCRVYDAGIVRNLRATIAYIHKKSGIPSREQYEGRTVGVWLTVKQISESSGMDAVIQASAIELRLKEEFPWLMQYVHSRQSQPPPGQQLLDPVDKAWQKLPLLATVRHWPPDRLNHHLNLTG